jgi:hypothetical protein
MKYSDVGRGFMPRNRRVKYYRCIVEYIDIGGASCPGNRRVTYLYKVYCEVH